MLITLLNVLSCPLLEPGGTDSHLISKPYFSYCRKGCGRGYCKEGVSTVSLCGRVRFALVTMMIGERPLSTYQEAQTHDRIEEGYIHTWRKGRCFTPCVAQ